MAPGDQLVSRKKNHITISGGSVTAIVSNRGAAIGSGILAGCGDITISGGSVTAISSDVGAGIGSGANGSCGDITISGGDVTANAGTYGEGIGSGSGGSCGPVTLTWTPTADGGVPGLPSITANSYASALTLKLVMPFRDSESGTVFAVSDGVDDTTQAAMAGKTLVPSPLAPEDVEVDPTSAILYVGGTQALKAKVLPAGSEQTVIWTIGDENIATVDESGNVTAVSPGKVTVTATCASDPSLSAGCTINVCTLPIGITVTPDTDRLYVGQTKALTAKVQDDDADPSVTWTSSDTTIATVDQTGKVTAKAAGTATITAETANGLTAKCDVKVYKAPTGVSVKPKKASLKVGKKLTLKATVKGKNAYPTLTWRSSNKKVATVSKKGVVTAKAPGKATITVKTVNGKTAKCVVTVTKSSTTTGKIKFD